MLLSLCCCGSRVFTYWLWHSAYLQSEPFFCLARFVTYELCPECKKLLSGLLTASFAVLQVAVIDDFLPNWSVISQIETLNEQLAADQAKAKAAAAEQQEGSEKENTHSQQHSQQHTNAEHESQHPADGPSDAPAQPEALGADLEHLELSDAPSSDLPKTEADAHHEAQRQVIKEVEYQAQLADMLQASSVANEPCEIPMWQVESLTLIFLPNYTDFAIPRQDASAQQCTNALHLHSNRFHCLCLPPCIHQ